MALLGEFEVAARQSEGEVDQFRFCGETFTVGEAGIIPLGRFAKAAISGVDTAEMEGLAAMLDLLADVVADEDRERFLDTAARHRAQADDLLPIVQAVIQAQAARPTRQPSVSSGGPSLTGVNLRASSSDPRAVGLQPVTEAGLSLVG